MSNKKAVALGFVLGVVACMLFAIGKRMLLPSALQALPLHATAIKEKVYINGFLPDFSYELEATVKQEGFNRFVKRMRFPLESRRSDTLYVVETPKTQHTRRAEYRDGILYYEESKN